MRAGEFPPEWVGSRFEADQWVRPQYARLAMGHTHAVYILLQISFRVVRRLARRMAKEGIQI